MAVQYTTYNTDGTTRTFPSTKHIATIQHVGVYLKRVVDNVWVVVNVNDYTLVQNSIIFDTAPDSVLYAQVEVRVADDVAEITTSPSDIALVAGSVVNVDTVATNIGAVNTVATNIGAVNTTSGSIANVNTVAANIANVNLTAGNTANINAVVANSANVTTVGLDLLEPISEINTVATDIVNVNAVGTNITSVNTVATNIANVNSIATTIVPNIAEILLADSNAIIATTQAGIATTQAGLASTSATEAQLRAWEAEAEKMTADSYATEAEDVFVKSYTSDGDGTFTATNTTEYSALHWSAKALINANFAPAVHASTSKTTPVDADEIPILDSASTFGLKKLTWANLKTTLGVLFAPLASPALTGDVSINGVNVGVYPYRNRIINGAMNVNQINGTTAVTPTTSSYVSDQWKCAISQASKLTFQQVADAPSGFKYSTKVTVASQYSPLATDIFTLIQSIEGQNITDFQFGTAGAVTINTSLQIKGSIAGTYSCSLWNGANNRTYVGTITIGTSWSKVSINLVGDTSGTWTTGNSIGLTLSIDLGSGTNFNTTAWTWQNGNFTRTSGSVTFVNQVVGSTLNITGVQLEKVPTGATQGTEYEWLPIEEAERRCRMYYRKVLTDTSGGGLVGAYRPNSANFEGSIFFEPMRTIPTATPVGTFSQMDGGVVGVAISNQGVGYIRVYTTSGYNNTLVPAIYANASSYIELKSQL